MVNLKELKEMHQNLIRSGGFAMQKIAQLNKTQRGAIVCKISKDNPKDGEKTLYPTDYMTLDNIKKNSILPADTIKMIEDYDVETQMVIVFMDSDNERVDAYRITPTH